MLEVLLVTPLLLASEPTKITLPNLTYDHASQTNVVNSGDMKTAQFRTFGGTQTFDYRGRPYDNDND